MQNTFTNDETVAVNILVTTDMLPIPKDVSVAELIGDDYVLVAKDDGALEQVVQGRHMVLHTSVASFLAWVGERPFWSFNPNKDRYERVRLAIENTSKE